MSKIGLLKDYPITIQPGMVYENINIHDILCTASESENNILYEIKFQGDLIAQVLIKSPIIYRNEYVVNLILQVCFNSFIYGRETERYQLYIPVDKIKIFLSCFKCVWHLQADLLALISP